MKKVKVGDLVRFKDALGLGIIVGPEEETPDQGSYVRWLWEGYVSLELNEHLEVLSEER